MPLAGVDVAHDVVVVLVSTAGSVVATVAVFRAKLAVADQRHDGLVAQIERDRAQDAALLTEKLDRVNQTVQQHARSSRAGFQTTERLLRGVLDIVASIAGQDGATKRLHTTDVLTRFLTEDDHE